MLKATALAPANIDFIKYWGQKNKNLNLPFNDSISMNLDNCYTKTTVEFSGKYKNDEVYFEILPLDKIAQLRNCGDAELRSWMWMNTCGIGKASMWMRQ